MSILAQLVIAALIFAAGAAGGIKWHKGVDAIAENERIASEAKIKAKQVDRIDVASTGHEKDKAQIRTEFLTITNTVEKIIREPFYLPSELCLNDDGLQQLATAIRAKPAASESQAAVPRPVATD